MIKTAPHPEERRLLHLSGSFDADWYRKTYPDSLLSGLDPMDHYLLHGYRMGRDPGPNFPTAFFKQLIPALDSPNEPATYLAWLQANDKSRLVIRPKNIPLELMKLANTGRTELAVKLARTYLPSELARITELLKANVAIKQFDDVKWLHHLNIYLSSMKMDPITLRGNGRLLSRFSSDVIKKVGDGPLVTVLMSVRNAKDTVVPAIKSILHQSWLNLEVFVIDDASTDTTWQLVEELAKSDPRIKSHRNPVSVGPYVNRNLGLLEASGDWITCHDGDDWSHPRRIELQVNEAAQYKQDVNLSNMLRMQEDGKFNWFAELSHFSPDGAARLASSSALFRKAFLVNKFGNWDSVRFAGDTEMFERIKSVTRKDVPVMSHVSQICLDHSGSLVRNEASGVSPVTGSSPTRKAYHQECLSAFRTSGAKVYYQFPQLKRPFPAPSEMLVPLQDVRACIFSFTSNVISQRSSTQ